MYEAVSLTLTKDQIINHWEQEVKSPGSSDSLTTYSNVTIQDYKDSDDILAALLPGGSSLKEKVALLYLLGGHSKIIPNLFLSGETFPNTDALTMIVNMSPDKKHGLLSEVKYPTAPGEHDGLPKIGAEEIGDMTVTIPVVRAIAACLINSQPVLVHCSSGKDRSPLIVTLALMVLYNASAEDAYRFVQIKRPIVGTRDEHQSAYWNIITDFEQNHLSTLREEALGWGQSAPDHKQLIKEAQEAATEAQASIDEDSNYATSGSESGDLGTNLYSSPVGERDKPTSGLPAKPESTRNWCATFGLAVPGAVLLTLSGLASTLAVRAAQSTELALVPFKLSDFFNVQSQVAAFCNTPLGYVAIVACAVAGLAFCYQAYQASQASQETELGSGLQ